MPKPARDRIAQLLSGAAPTRRDSAVLRLPADALRVEVDGVGLVATPIGAPMAKRLIAAARAARFGRGEETLHDAAVRDTWELTPDQVALAGPRWQQQLDAALRQFADDLGLPEGARLRAELHSMLVYGKGQFFLPHQDSEKHDDMVASLVVMLPSIHTGGDLVVDDGGHERTYRGSRDELVLVAFYADRRHEVKPVRSGHRVTLTFNLLLQQPDLDVPPDDVARAAGYLTEHFATSNKSPYGGRDLGKPARLAFLLDHEYTQAALSAGRFKGADAGWAATLLAAGVAAGCDCVLATAEIHETWSADDYDGYDLQELIDDEIVLDWWVRPDGSGAEKVSLPVSAHEVCAVTPTRSITPYDTEYEGYMGNYGNTLDRWYRRAALVLWPAATSFAARAEASSTWALDTLLARASSGELEDARSDALTMEPFWRNLDAALLAPTLQVAVALGDPDVAEMLVAPFTLQALTAEQATLLADLARAYGDPWTRGAVTRWATDSRLQFARTDNWVSDELQPLAHTLRALKQPKLADAFADAAWRGLRGPIQMWVSSKHPAQRATNLAALGVPTARVLEAASDELGASIVAELRALDEAVSELMVPVLRAHTPGATPTPMQTPALVALADDCRDRLTRLVDRPDRAADDWSINWTGCGCDPCQRLGAFLASRSERTHEWPLATPGREHVHRQVDNAGLPVRHTTRRTGRPYTLLLTKTDELFSREAEQAGRARADLEWVSSVYDR